MSETTEIIKTYAPLVTPFIPAIVDVFVKPKLQRLSKFLKKNDAQSLISVDENFCGIVKFLPELREKLYSLRRNSSVSESFSRGFQSFFASLPKCSALALDK